MTADKFRALALSLPGTIESAHQGHPDFRVGGRIFATLGYPDDEWGMVKFTPAQQKESLREAPKVFAPCRGAWGRGGATQIHLKSARISQARAALETAWRNLTSP